MIGYVITVIVLYYVCSILKSPAKLLRVVKPKRKSIKKKSTKYQFEDEELGKFKLNKLTVKAMLDKKFIYPSDPYQSEEKYKKAFLLGLENYLLYRYPTAKLVEINVKIQQIVKGNYVYWMNLLKQYV